MIINNPTSLAGFTRTSVTGATETEYQLATIGQVRTAINNINKKFEELLKGTAGSPGDEADRSDQVTGGGLKLKKGYAWIASNGKIEPSLLPNLAITNTYVVPYGAIQPLMLNGSGNNEYSIYDALSMWCKDQIAHSVDTGISEIRKGDILIITPTDNTTDVSYTTEDVIINEEGGRTNSRANINPAYLGTYIVTQEPINEDPYIFAKMAYTDTSIVTINGIAPTNSAGQLTLYLHDILKTGFNDGTSDTMSDAETLSNVVYNLRSGSTKPIIVSNGVNNTEYVRFGFKSNSLDSGIEDRVFFYTTTEEYEAEQSKREADDNFLSSAILQLRAESEAEDASINNKIAGISGIVGTSGAIQNLNDPAVFNAAAAMTAPVFTQLEALRYSVDYNAEMLDTTRNNTNALLRNLYSNIDSLYSNLNGRAVAFIEREITWTASGDENCTYTNAPGTYSTDDLVYNSENAAAENAVIGKWIWKYTYKPSVVGTTVDETAAHTYRDAYKNSGANNGDTEGTNDRTIKSDERIVAVFDEYGNQINVDIQRVLDDSTGVYDSVITVVVDNVGTENGMPKNSLNGVKWTLLIAKTIVGIENIHAVTDIAVGKGRELSNTRDRITGAGFAQAIDEVLNPYTLPTRAN
jgi:hypothetical protein